MQARGLPAVIDRRYSYLFQPACSRLLSRENRLIPFAVAVRDGAEQTIAVNVQSRQRNASEIRGGEYQVGVFDSDLNRRSNVVVSFIDHRFAVALIRGCSGE